MAWTHWLSMFGLSLIIAGGAYEAGRSAGQARCVETRPAESQGDRDFLRPGPRLPETGNRRF